MPHLFLGSIGVLAETSDIQRRAYNQAMQQEGLPWVWDEDVYRRLLTMSGGKKRLRLLADATGADVSDDLIDRVHSLKTQLACKEVVDRQVPLRPGVAALIKAAEDRGFGLGLVTTTYRPNVDAIAAAAGDQLPLDRFVTVVTTEDVTRGKPSPEAYEVALERAGADPASTLVVEDSAASVLSAAGAGLRVLACPGAMHVGTDMAGAEATVASLGTEDELNDVVEALLDSIA